LKALKQSTFWNGLNPGAKIASPRPIQVEKLKVEITIPPPP